MLTLAKVSPLLLPLLLAPHTAAENSTEGEYSTVQYSTGGEYSAVQRVTCIGVWGQLEGKSAYAVRSPETQIAK